jgi:ASC-1-like (ASCH) protein
MVHKFHTIFWTTKLKPGYSKKVILVKKKYKDFNITPRQLKTVILKKYKYNTFMDMIIAHGIKNVLPNIETNNGKDTLYNGVGIYRKFYSHEDEKKYGVVDIKVKVIK